MANKVKYKRVPFDILGKSLFSFLFAELMSIWIVAIFTLFFLPTIIPSNFNWSGIATASGYSITIIITALLFSIVPAVILIVSFFRYKLLNYYRYLLTAPIFYSNLKGVASSRRGYWINQYFKMLLTAGVYFSCILLVVLLEVYAAAEKNSINGAFVIVIPVVSIVLVAVLMLLLVKSMYKEMEKEIKSKRRRR